MSGLSLHVRGFRAIKSADIELAGLTVLAGVNSSGKSTLARLFHRLVCVEANYEAYAANEVHRYFLKSVIEPLKKVLDAGDVNRDLRREIEWLASSKGNLARNGLRLIENMTNALRKLLTDAAANQIVKDQRFVKSMYMYVPRECPDVPRLIDADMVVPWVDELKQFFSNYYKRLVSREAGSSFLYFTSDIAGETLDGIGRTGYEGTMLEKAFDRKPSIELRITDGDVRIVDFEDSALPMGKVFSLRQSFYIGRPSVDFPSVRMRKLKLNGIEYPLAGTRMIDGFSNRPEIGVESIIGGKVSAPREKGYVATTDWLYSNGGESYRLDQCADGIKSLATISILDRYNLLDAGTLLIIDEPEVHLHPQWVVGMAHVLVRLAKERNVKVLITTHSPDLVHAIRDFSENENFADNTCFYLSHKKSDADLTYSFRKLGMDIGPIFSVFNVAKDRIAEISQTIREGRRG